MIFIKICYSSAFCQNDVQQCLSYTATLALSWEASQPLPTVPSRALTGVTNVSILREIIVSDIFLRLFFTCINKDLLNVQCVLISFVLIYLIMTAGGIFRLYIKFNEQYNSRPPEVCFHTIPFHPNGKFSEMLTSCKIRSGGTMVYWVDYQTPRP